MKNRRNYYRILQVQPDAPIEVIRASYRTMMHRLKMHPDLGGDHWNAALVNEAFAVVSDPAKRAAYDAMNRLREQQRNPVAVGQTVVSLPLKNTDDYRACPFCRAKHPRRRAESEMATCYRCGSALFPVPRREASTSKRRAMERMSVRMPVTCTDASRPDRKLEMTTENLSLRGMYLKSPYRLSPGQVLKIEHSFGTAVGVVTRVSVDWNGSHPQWYAGVRFLTMQITQGRGVFLSMQG